MFNSHPDGSGRRGVRLHHPLGVPFVLTGLLVALPLLVVSCRDRLHPSTPTDVSVQSAGVPEDIDLRSLGGIEEVFAEVGSNVPGFAGFYVSHGKLVVAETQPDHGPAALDAVANIRSGQYLRGPYGPWPAVTKHVHYSFFQLARWRNAVRANLLSKSFLTGLDLDEELNAIRAIVPTEGDRALARQAFLNLGIPDDAIVTSVGTLDGAIESGPAATSPYADSTLSNSLRPVKGGQRISKRNTNGAPNDAKTCSLGVNAVLDFAGDGVDSVDHRGFLTAAHCTDTLGVVQTDDSLWFAADTTAPSTYLGHEGADWDPFIDSVAGEKSCERNVDCFWADASFQHYHVPDSVWSWGKIWNVISATTTIDTTNSDLTITQVDRSVPPSDSSITLTKLGEGQGRSSGTLSATCVDLPSGFATSGKQAWILCSDEVDAHADGGDSGGPVYRPVDGSSENVELFGIEWSSLQDRIGYHFFFSSIGLIERQLDPLVFIPTN